MATTTVCIFFILLFLYLAGRYLPVFVHVFDFSTGVLKCTGNGTFKFKEVIFTSHPEDIRHVMSRSFWNYPKGPDTKLIFEAYGEFLFSTDRQEWKEQREIAHAFFNSHVMNQFAAQKVNLKILSEGLVPVFDDHADRHMPVDLQDVFRRFMLDATSMVATGYNHGSLRVRLPEDEFLTALHEINQGILLRHILPERLWKIQRWLRIGKEKKLLEAWETLDRIISKEIDIGSRNIFNNEKEQKSDAIKFTVNLGLSDKLRTDMIKILLFGGTDTASSALTWFFLQVLENPVLENKIREEINEKLIILSSPAGKLAGIRLIYDPEELNKLVYLHAAMLETMRLYPPAPFHSRTCCSPDILPSGHKVNSMMKIVPCYYSMGRMESVWGEDCLNFKPERWISEEGKIIPVPADKFVAFGLGPRTCLGKNLGLIRLKAV